MTQAFQVTLNTLKSHQDDSKKLQVKLLSLMMDATNGKRGMEEILELARWASALPGLGDYAMRMLAAKQETLKMQGLEITVADDVPMKSVQEIMSLQVVRPAVIAGPDFEQDDDNQDEREDDNDEE